MCVNIGCCSFLSTGALAARVRGFSQRLATTGILYLGLFSLLSMKGTNSWQWYSATHETKSERLQILLIPHPPPTLFAKFNLAQHGLALRSRKGERGRYALKAALEEACGGGGIKGDAQTSFLWTEESVVQMFEGKQGNCLPVGAVPQ